MSPPAESAAGQPLRPVVPFLRLPEAGLPRFQGLRCDACGEVFLDRRETCAKCLTRGRLSEAALASTGRLYTWTVVRRSFPGIPVPYISAVVDLDGGGCVKGNLVQLSPESEALRQGLEVEAAFEEAPYGDKAGNRYMLYHFRPKDSQLRTETAETEAAP